MCHKRRVVLPLPYPRKVVAGFFLVGAAESDLDPRPLRRDGIVQLSGMDGMDPKPSPGAAM
jgi:hypothetical protein